MKRPSPPRFASLCTLIGRIGRASASQADNEGLFSPLWHVILPRGGRAVLGVKAHSAVRPGAGGPRGALPPETQEDFLPRTGWSYPVAAECKG